MFIYVVCRYGLLSGDDATIGAYTDQSKAESLRDLYEQAYGGHDTAYGVESLVVDGDDSMDRRELAEIIEENGRESAGGAS